MIPVGAARRALDADHLRGLPLPGLRRVREAVHADHPQPGGQRADQDRIPPGHPDRRQSRRQRLAERGERGGLRPGRRQVPRLPRRPLRQPARRAGRQVRPTRTTCSTSPEGPGAEDRRPSPHCVKQRHTRPWVKKSNEAFSNSGFDSTPTILLNGKSIFGQNPPLTPDSLKQMVAAANKGKQPGKVTATRPDTRSRGGPRARHRAPRRYPDVAGRAAAHPSGTVASDIAMELAFIPSPSHGVVHLGPIPLRGYAFCIIIGVFVAVWFGNKRWIARGGTAGHGRGHRRVGGAVRPGRRPALPRDHRLRAVLHRRARTGSTPSRCGRAGSASGARSPSARWAPGSAAAAAASRCRPTPTPSRPASPSRRPSAAGATGSTRSCTAGRPPCRGA